MTAAITPVLGLPQYAALEDFDYTEINNGNLQIDRLPPTVCTSATRPTDNLFQGRLIWETDTKKLYMYDASTTTWRRIQYMYDSGWVSPTLSGGWTNAAGAALQVRQLGDHVSFRGGIVNASFTGGYTTAVTLPGTIAFPSTPLALPVSYNTTIQRSVNMNTDGTISVYASAASSAAWYLGGGYLL